MHTTELSIMLPDDMVRAIQARVGDGGYANHSEIIREALGRWIERERHVATLEAEVRRGIADADAGRLKTSEEVLSSLLERIGTGEAPAGG